MNAPPRCPRPPVWWPAALIVLGALLAYANSFGVPFLFDDIPGIVDNPSLRRLWPPPGLGGTSETGGLTTSGRPVFALSLALNHTISGHAVASYHAFNLGVHLLAGLALFGLLRRTLARLAAFRSQPAVADRLSLLIAFLWTVHPLQTESVTYLVQRAEAMAGLFYLLTLYAFTRATECHPLDDTVFAASEGETAQCHPLDDTSARRRRTLWLAAAVAACAVGMATKEVMVTAPMVVWLYDRTLRSGGAAGTFRGPLRARPLFYAALAATWLLLGALLWTTGGNRGGTVGLGVGVTPWAYALTQFEAVTRYLWLSVWPHPLVFEYGTFWVQSVAEALPFACVVGVVLAATLTALFSKRPAAGFLGACFFVLLAPTSLTPGTIQMIVEHRMYLPLAAVLAALAAGLHACLGLRALWVLGAAGGAGLGLTLARNADYRDEFTLWRDTVAKRPRNAIALTNLGLAHYRAGRPADAARTYERALAAHPGSVEAHYNLAIACAKLGRIADALHHYGEALRLRPGFAAAHNNLGLTLAAAGRADEAARHYREALRLAPAFAEPHHNLGDLLLKSGRAAESVGEFEAALRLRPAYAEAQFNLGNACAQLGRMADAVRHYEAALRLRPAFADAHVNLGNVLLQLERVPAAVQHYRSALESDPAHAEAHNNLGNVLLHTGRVAEAIAHFREALRLRPGYPEAQRHLADALARPPP